MAVFRRTLRPHAWFALYAFLCGWMLPFLEAHPLGQDDAACLVMTSGSAAPQIDSPRANDSQPAHCVVCHLMRAMSGAVSADVTTLAVPFAATSRHLLPNGLTLTACSAAPSSRGPPASL